MVSDDMRLFFWDVGAVGRALTEMRSVPHSLTAEEWTVEPFEWVLTEPCGILASGFFVSCGDVPAPSGRSYQELLELPDQPVPAAIKESAKDSVV